MNMAYTVKRPTLIRMQEAPAFPHVSLSFLVPLALPGKAAQKKSAGVSPSRHSLLKAGHPSPLAVRFFAGCGHFAKCNELLVKMGKEPIDFKLKP
ncbi:hypothetical protein cyc_05320 [Cyclospora cayetanensis]|uniref:Uncharacterized protein n=1 Tax=Cyclospora cayetanensis TaxID=88456 RepID=A0A1D3D920_9EIME|nr:hypothetical protein cyc_05320 [Cyclospora cayetanensis]